MTAAERPAHEEGGAQMTQTGSADTTATTGPDEIRAEIEQTREELGHTVEALAAKADVKARAQEKTAELKAKAGEKLDGTKQQLQQKGPKPALAAGLAVAFGLLLRRRKQRRKQR